MATKALECVAGDDTCNQCGECAKGYPLGCLELNQNTPEVIPDRDEETQNGYVVLSDPTFCIQILQFCALLPNRPLYIVRKR